MFGKLTIRAKLAVAFGLIGSLLLVVSLINTFTLEWVSGKYHRVSDDALSDVVTLNTMRASMADLRVRLNRVGVPGLPSAEIERAYVRIGDDRREYDAADKAFRALPIGGWEAELYGEVARSHAIVDSLAANIVRDRKSGNAANPARFISRVSELRGPFDGFDHSIDALIAFQTTEARNEFADGHRAGRIATTMSIALTITGAAWAFVMSRSLASRLTRGLEAEQSLRDREAHAAAVLGSMLEGVVTMDSHSRILHANAAMEKIFGYGTGELIGKPVHMLMAEPHGSGHSGYVASYMATGIKKIIGTAREVEAQRKDGSLIPVTLSVTEIESSAGVLFTGVITDISERKRAENEVLAKERLLRTVFDTLPLNLVVKDADTRHQMVNKAWCERYGLTPDQVIGRKTMEIPGRPEAHRLFMLEQDRKTLAAAGTIVFETQDTISSGEIRHYQSIGSAIRDERGRVSGLVGVTVELTELKRAEENLRASERLLQTVFDTIPHQLFVKNAQSRYLMVNKAWLEAYGVHRDKAIHADTLAIPNRPQSDAREFVEEDQQVLSGNQTRLIADRIVTQGDGRQRHFHSIKVPLRDEDGNAVGVVGLMVDMTAEKEAQRRAELANSRLQDAIECLPAAFFLFDAEERLVMWNGQVGKFFPELHAELKVGRSIADIFLGARRYVTDKDGDAGESIQSRLRRLRENPGMYQIKLSDGRWLQAIDQHTSDGGTVCLRIDITEAKQREQALKASQALLRTVVDTIPHSIVVKDLESRYLMVNRAWCETYGIPPEAALHQSSFDVPRRSESERRHVMEDDRKLFAADGSTVIDETIYRIPQGDERYVKSYKNPLRDESGRVIGLVGIYVDVTDEKKARDKADIAHARLFDAIESLPASFLLYSPDEKLVLWNSQIGEFFPGLYPHIKMGMAAEEALRLGAGDIDDAKGRLDAWVQERLQQMRTQPAQYYEQKLADGRWLRGIDHRTSEGGLVILRFDITQSKKREEELRQAQKMEAIGQLTGGIAHDFNNILAVIMSFGEMVLDGLEQGSPLHSDMKTILDAAGRAAALTRQLLAFGRQQVLRMEPVDLNEVVTGMDKMLRRVIPENIDLRLRPAPDLDPVKADRSQIEQIIMNLAVNARDAMPDGGKLTVETADSNLGEEDVRRHGAVTLGPHTMLVVSDTGTGMDKETQARIFEPFFTTKPVGSGTGLGLATVYGIVKQMGGTIWVYSELGKGTTFKIFFPVLPGQKTVMAPAEGERLAEVAGSETILLVEDEESVREAARRILTGHGYTVHVAKNGNEAVELLKTNGGEIDCILSDVVMPGMSTKELLEAVRKRTDVPIVFMSGYTDISIVNQGVLDGGTPFLHKPFTKRSLLDKMREVLSARSSAAC